MRARRVGQELLRAAQRSGRNSSDMAKLLGWSPSKVSRLLSGKRVASTEDVAAYLALCGVTGAARNEILALAKRSDEQSWWQDHGARLPIHVPVLIDNEAAAVGITFFGNTLIPDLLRAPDYARAVLTTQPNIPADEIAARVAETRRRQHILDRSYASPNLLVFLAEYALGHVGAGCHEMSDQLHHLLRLAVRPDITIRVIPEGHNNMGVHEIGPFTFYEFTEHQPAVYLEHATSTAFLEQPDTITTYRELITELDRSALSGDASRDRIADIAQRNAQQAAPSTQTDGIAIWAGS